MIRPESVEAGEERPRGRAGKGVWHLRSRPVCPAKTAVQPGPGDPASASILGARVSSTKGGPRGSAHAWLESQP